MAHIPRRSKKTATQRKPAPDPARVQLAMLKRQRRTQRELAWAALGLAHSVSSTHARLRQAVYNIADELGMIAVSKEQYETLQTRIDVLTARTAQLAKPADERERELVGADS